MGFRSRPYVLHEGMQRVGSVASEEEICRLEARLGLKFDGEYRQFLLEVNGVSCGTHGKVIRPVDRQYNLNITRLVEGLYAADQLIPSETQMLEHKRAEHFRKRVPERFLVIGYGVYWDLICISLSGPDRGTVYYWEDARGSDEELSESDDSGPTERFLFPAGRNFREFWDSLKSPERHGEL